MLQQRTRPGNVMNMSSHPFTQNIKQYTPQPPTAYTSMHRANTKFSRHWWYVVQWTKCTIFDYWLPLCIWHLCGIICPKIILHIKHRWVKHFNPMLPGLFILSRVPESDTRHSDMGVDTPTLVLSQKHVKFSNYCRVRHSDTYPCWTLLAESG